MGDPLGIGPEIVVKALADKRAHRLSAARYLVYGLDAPLRAAAHRAGIEPFWTSVHAADPSTAPVVLVEPQGLGAERAWVATLLQAHTARASTLAGGASCASADDTAASSSRRNTIHAA